MSKANIFRNFLPDFASFVESIRNPETKLAESNETGQTIVLERTPEVPTKFEKRAFNPTDSENFIIEMDRLMADPTILSSEAFIERASDILRKIKTETEVPDQIFDMFTQIASAYAIKKPSVATFVEKKKKEEKESTSLYPTKNGNTKFSMFMKNGLAFAELMVSTSKMFSEVRLYIEEKGITVVSMDGSHIALVHFFLSKNDFDAYEIDEECYVGINLGDVASVMKRAKKKDQGVRFFADGKSKKVSVAISEEGVDDRVFTLALIDIDSEEINLESLNAMEFDNRFDIAIPLLENITADAEIYSEVLQIKCVDGFAIFSTEGSVGDYELKIKANKLDDFHWFANSDSSFAIQFMKVISGFQKVLKKANGDPIISMKLKQDAPLLVMMKFYNESYIQAFLAPRVEEETKIEE